MPLPSRPRILLGDEELGKRDDDHKPGGRGPLAAVWSASRAHAGRKTMKRLAMGLAALVFFYYFFKNMPTDLEPQTGRPHYQSVEYAGNSRPSKPPGLTPEEHEASEERQHYFNGAIKFYSLAATLNKITNARSPNNNNVLFAASSLKSAAILIPIACEMAEFQRNKVHFALMGRDEISMDILRSVNGYTTQCSVMFHGAFLIVVYMPPQTKSDIFSQTPAPTFLQSVPIFEWRLALRQL